MIARATTRGFPAAPFAALTSGYWNTAVFPEYAYRVFLCRAAHLALARASDLRFHAPNQDLTIRFAMVKNRLRHRSREVAIALAITLAAIAAVIATLSSQEENAQTAEPMALVTPKK